MFKKSLAALAALLGVSAAFAQAAAPAVAASAAVATTAAAEVGFFAAIGGFLAGFLLTWPALIAIVFFGILAEHNDGRGFAVFLALLGAGVAFFFFNMSLIALAMYVVGYIVIGLVWSWYRYKRHAADVVEKHQNSNDSTKERALQELHPKAMLGTITAWIMVWPFSLVENFVGDLINAIQSLVSKFFRGVYHKIYDSAVAALTAK